MNLESSPTPPSKRGPKTPEGRAAALANLKAFGKDRQPTRRRTTAGDSLLENVNRMKDFTRAKLRKVIADKSAGATVVGAAHQLLELANGDGPTFDRLMDRTIGNAMTREKTEIDTTAQVVVQHTHSLAVDESADRTAAIQAIIDKRAAEAQQN